jgi:hypothetical protein
MRRTAERWLAAIIVIVATGCPTTTTTTTTTTTSTTKPPTTTSTTTLPPDTTPPSTPTGLSTAASSCSQINLSWNASTDTGGSGLKGYDVYRNGAFLKRVLTPATSTSDTGLAASTVYSYSVKAIDNALNASGSSSTATTNTPACADVTAPSVPTGLSATASSCTRVDVAWSASTDSGGSGLKGYNVYRNGGFLTQIAAPATSYADNGLAPGGTYSYRAAAVDNAGNASALGTAASATTPSVDLGLVGFVPGIGTPNDVALNAAAGLAYVASTEFGLSVVDVHTPGAPVAIGAANPPFYGQRVAASGTLAVVGARSLGMNVVDVTTPARPTTVGQLAGDVSAVALVGQTAYALLVVPGNPSHVDLAVVSLANPASPTITGRVTLGMEGLDLKVVGSLAYVAAGSAGLQIVDVSHPTAPAVVRVVDTPGSAASVVVANGRAYVADGTALRIVDVAASPPAIVGSLATSATALAVVGSRVYAVDGLLLKVVDASTPTAPVLLNATSDYGATRLDASGTVAFLTSANMGTSQGGLYVWNVASTPAMLANVRDAFDSRGVAVAGTLAVAAGSTLGMKVVDLGVPATPRVVGTLAGTVLTVAMAGQTAYALLLVPGNPSHVDLAVVSLAVPSSPAIVGRITLGSGGSALGSGIVLVGSIAYVAPSINKLAIVSVASPSAPTLVGSLDMPGTATSIALAGRYAYVAAGTSIQVVDVGTPSRPVVAGSVATSAMSLALAGSRVYTVDGAQLKVVDVTTPTAPVLLSATTGYGAQGIAAAGTVVYLATPAGTHGDTNGGVRAVDVSNPAQPRVVERLVVPGLTRSLTAGVASLYAADANGVVDVISVGP